MEERYDFIKLFNDYGISYKNGERGFIDIDCPFCRDGKYHGGVHEEKSYFNCWVCGYKQLERIIMILTNQNWAAIKQNYILNPGLRDIYLKDKVEVYKNTVLSYPPETIAVTPEMRKYLIKRKFDPDHIISKYRIKGTGHVGSYNYRILIPIFYEGQLVSYQGRDYTGLSNVRYKACAIVDEVIHHKNILYNLDNCIDDHCVVVEGPTDVWRLGENSCATFGTGYTQAQVNLLANRFKKITLLYDSETEAQNRANKLGNMLSGLGVDINIVLLPPGIDPGDLSQNDADDLMNNLRKSC